MKPISSPRLVPGGHENNAKQAPPTFDAPMDLLNRPAYHDTKEKTRCYSQLVVSLLIVVISHFSNRNDHNARPPEMLTNEVCAFKLFFQAQRATFTFQ